MKFDNYNLSKQMIDLIKTESEIFGKFKKIN